MAKKAEEITKSYTVKYNEPGKKRPRSIDFPTLADAREFGLERMREDAFVSLTNPKGVVLPLAAVNKQQVAEVNY